MSNSGDFELHVFAQLLVERAKRLVHQHQLGFEHQSARQGDTLLLTARKLRGASPAELAHLNHVQCALHFRFAIRLAHPPDFQRKGEVFSHRHMREKRIVLKNHADSALVRRDIVDRSPVQLDLAVCRSFKPGKHHETGGLT